MNMMDEIECYRTAVVRVAQKCAQVCNFHILGLHALFSLTFQGDVIVDYIITNDHRHPTGKIYKLNLK